jgi:predicted GNAT superfamily acetyltransferase
MYLVVEEVVVKIPQITLMEQVDMAAAAVAVTVDLSHLNLELLVLVEEEALVMDHQIGEATVVPVSFSSHTHHKYSKNSQ